MQKKTQKVSYTIDSLLTDFRSIFLGKDYIPLSQTALLAQLKVPASQKSLAKEALNQMLAQEEIVIEKSKILYKGIVEIPFIGILRMNPRGFGFVIAENQKHFPEDAFIPKHLTGNAIDGDLVEVELFLESKKDKGPEGKVISILQRGRSHLGGIVRIVEPSGSILVHSPLLGPNKPIKVISHSETPLKYGDRVIVKIVDWGGQNKPILCEVTQILGHISDAAIDIEAAAEEFQIAREFPKDVLAQAKSFGKQVSPKDFVGRLDLTETESITIDPETARDFDDALSLSKDDKGLYHLGVHIADVAHYVTPGSPLDIEAERRSNSTYFPGACLPMLPEELSNNLCSLKPNVIRLCMSVLMTLNSEGDVLKHEIKRTYIKSAKRFSYEEAKEVLDKKKKSIHKPTLELMVELCLLLKQKRSARGSIDFSLPEVVLNISPLGEPLSHHIVEYDITHQMVEEYMLKANEIVAKTLGAKGQSLIFRVHEEPALENKEDFFTLARSLGFEVPGKPTSKDVQKLFEHAKATPFAGQLSVAFIRSMRLASYSSDNIGHFGLALEEYCHFTSPIRRYPDLIIQRLLCNEHPQEKDLQQIAENCSTKERISFKAEQSVKMLKKLRLLKRWITEDPEKVYDCQITKIKPFGITFELTPLSVEGSLHVSEIEGDYFVYEPVRNCFLGRKTHVRFCIGDTIQMQIQSVDLVLLEVKWKRVFEGGSPPPPRTHRKEKRRKRRR